MIEPMTYLAVGSLALIGLTIALFAGLKGWQGWLDLKRLELAGHQDQQKRSPAMERIEIADLKERVRKLETIASCVDL
jgi:hypothetical protein